MTTMLDTHLSKKKWLSIFLLTIGVIAVNLDGVSNNMRKSGLENLTKDLAKDVVKTKGKIMAMPLYYYLLPYSNKFLH